MQFSPAQTPTRNSSSSCLSLTGSMTSLTSALDAPHAHEPLIIQSDLEADAQMMELLAGLEKFAPLPPIREQLVAPGNTAFAASSIGSTLRGMMPKLVDQVNQLGRNVNHTSDAYQRLLHLLGIAVSLLAWIQSTTTTAAIGARVEAVLATVETNIMAKVNARLTSVAGGDEDVEEGGRPSKRAKRDTALQGLVHKAVCSLLRVDYSTGPSGKVIHGDGLAWPVWTGDSVREEVVDGTMKKVYWKVNWGEKKGWFDFIHEAVTIVQKENPELKVNEWTIKEAVKTYMTTIARTVREGNEARIAGNLRAAPASRKTKLEEHMATAFHVSALARCKESSWYRLAFVDSKNRYLDLWKKEEGHDMVCSFPNPNDGNIDLDGFILLSDLWHQRRTDVGEFYLARAPEWWSDELALAFWVLYETTISDANLNITARKRPFLVASSYFGRECRPVLREIVNESAPATKRTKRKIPRQGWWISRWMVKPSYLAEHPEWALRLPEAPTMSVNDMRKPSLEELLEKGTEMEVGLLAKARQYLKRGIAPSRETLLDLWDARQSEDLDGYAAILRAVRGQAENESAD